MLTALILLLVFIFLLLGGFFSCAEVAITSADRANLHAAAADGDRRAQLVQRLLERKELLLGTTLVGINLMMVSATTLASMIVSQAVAPRWESVVNTLVMTPLILVIAELVPKSLGRSNPEHVAKAIAHPLMLAQRIAYPLIAGTTGIACAVARIFGTPPSGKTQLTREDIRAIAELAGEEGLLPEGASVMLQTVFDLSAKAVSSVMIPLVDVVAVSEDATLTSVSALAAQTGYSRYPVYRGRIDEIVGIIDLRRLIYALGETGECPSAAQAEGFPIRDYIQTDIAYVPETKSVGELLHELHYHRIPMAAAVDEHGGVVGIVTAEDLIEEVVGEIRDERDPEEDYFSDLGEGVYQCEGKLEIRELSNHLGVDFEADGFETVAGLVLKLAGRIPAVGERFTARGFEFLVMEVDRRRVRRVQLTRNPPNHTSDSM